jgi:GNAT superfamily N-acetyltransferase
MTDVVVRGVRREDLSAVVELLIGGSLTPEVESLDRLDDYWAAVVDVRSKDGEVFVAEDGDGVVGVCQVVIFRNIGHHGQRVAEVENVHVRADRRSGGIGALLLAACEVWARDAACHRLQLTSNVERIDAHRFYERLGFRASHKGFKKSLRG